MVEGTDPKTGEIIIRPDIAPNTRMWCRPGELQVVEPEIECRVSDIVETDAYRPGTRVRHLKFGDGTVKGAEGKTVLVAFDDAETRKVLPAFLQIVEPSADPHANFQHQETADNVVRIPVVKPQAMDC
jgi:hypothetical protein